MLAFYNKNNLKAAQKLTGAGKKMVKMQTIGLIYSSGAAGSSINSIYSSTITSQRPQEKS